MTNLVLLLQLTKLHRMKSEENSFQVDSFQLSDFSYQLSDFRFQLSVVSYQWSDYYLVGRGAPVRGWVQAGLSWRMSR